VSRGPSRLPNSPRASSCPRSAPRTVSADLRRDVGSPQAPRSAAWGRAGAAPLAPRGDGVPDIGYGVGTDAEVGRRGGLDSVGLPRGAGIDLAGDGLEPIVGPVGSWM
jgi:hypothetical protein